MSDYIAPPSSVTWTLDPPVALGSSTYSSVTLRAPTGADVLKSIAVPGENGLQVTLRLISGISQEGIPFEALMLVASWQIEQMSHYLEMFNGAPLPGPLVQYAAAVRAASAPPAASA